MLSIAVERSIGIMTTKMMFQTVLDGFTTAQLEAEAHHRLAVLNYTRNPHSRVSRNATDDTITAIQTEISWRKGKQ